MLSLFKFIRRTVQGALIAIIFVTLAALLKVSPTINVLLAERTIASGLFLIVLVIVIADLIGKLIGILSAAFPDLVPKVEKSDLQLAALVERLRPGQTIALLSGAQVGRIIVFIIIFALLGATYAAAPEAAQMQLVGPLSAREAFEIFLRESVAGSVGYFLFFLGPDTLKPLIDAIAAERLSSASVDGDFYLAGLRLYGLPFVLALLQFLATPIIFVRARVRARLLGEEMQMARA